MSNNTEIRNILSVATLAASLLTLGNAFATPACSSAEECNKIFPSDKAQICFQLVCDKELNIQGQYDQSGKWFPTIPEGVVFSNVYTNAQNPDQIQQAFENIFGKTHQIHKYQIYDTDMWYVDMYPKNGKEAEIQHKVLRILPPPPAK